MSTHNCMDERPASGRYFKCSCGKEYVMANVSPGAYWEEKTTADAQLAFLSNAIRTAQPGGPLKAKLYDAQKVYIGKMDLGDRTWPKLLEMHGDTRLRHFLRRANSNDCYDEIPNIDALFVWLHELERPEAVEACSSGGG